MQISLGSTNLTYTQQGYKATFRVVARHALHGPTLVRHALDSLHMKRIAVVDESTTYGQGLADEFIKAASWRWRVHRQEVEPSGERNRQRCMFRGGACIVKMPNGQEFDWRYTALQGADRYIRSVRL
jgi:hypothetical protein